MSRQSFWYKIKAPSPVMRSLIASFCLLVLLSPALIPIASAQEKLISDISAGLPAGAPQQFFAKHCQECHSGPKPKGEFSLKSLSQNFADAANRERWEAVATQLQAGTMPPVKKPRPPVAEVNEVLDWIGTRMATVTDVRDTAAKQMGMRRLTRNEYANTIRDLLTSTTR